MNYLPVDHDFDKRSRERFLRGRPWTFTNLLPFEVKVYFYRPHLIDLVGYIAPRGTLVTAKSKKGYSLEVGDEMHITYPKLEKGREFAPQGSVPEFEIIRPFYLFDDSRMVNIGDTVYQDRHNTQVILHRDISGIRVHNHISIPIKVYQVLGKDTIAGTAGRFTNAAEKGQRVLLAEIGPDDGTSFMSGSTNSAFIDNNYFGFRIGDQLEIVFADGRKNVPHMVVQITDNFTSDILVGETSQHTDNQSQSFFSYRIDAPNITQTRYFEPVTAYCSRSTR